MNIKLIKIDFTVSKDNTKVPGVGVVGGFFNQKVVEGFFEAGVVGRFFGARSKWGERRKWGERWGRKRVNNLGEGPMDLFGYP